jgi:hypothetical protein
MASRAMATVYVHADRAKEFRNLFVEWRRQRGASIISEPAEGLTVADETQFTMGLVACLKEAAYD